ncbi:AAA family ATPase [Trichodesmium erythraeum 21-75]|nr:AAA family ATPase [Trichodesmium erythraeum 21-75]
MELLSSPWIAEFAKQRQHGQHSVIYGNIYDQVIYRNNALTVEEFLNSYFQDNNFEIILYYSQLEGYRFEGEKNGLTSYEKFYHIVNPNGLPKAYDPHKTRNNIAPGAAIADISKVLEQNTVTAVAIINLGDLLTSEANRYSSEERLLLAGLKKATLKASLVESNKEMRRNTLIILGSDLKRIPEWLYFDNPYVELVQVSLPSRDIRCHYTKRILSNFYQDLSLTQDSNYEAIVTRELADLTEGFRLLDIRSLSFTSLKHQISLQPRNIWRLVDCYKFGKRADPWEKLDFTKIQNAQAQLSSRVIGQDKAVKTVTDILVSAKVGLTMNPEGTISSKPKGIFFFVGPTGVGKTELAKALTELVFGDEKAFARFDMSEYKEQHAAEKLTGSPPGFVGYGEGGQLTNRVLENPYSILLFDEIEKAHSTVLDKFLQILEDGRLTDGQGKTAYFNQSIIIFTSNIGASKLLQEKANLQTKDYTEIEFFLNIKSEIFF